VRTSCRPKIATLADKLISRSETAGGFRVAPGSAFAGDDRHCQPYHASHAAMMSITAAADHLHALCALVLQSGFLHLAAPATLARGVLESASAAVWIANPTLRDERITRALKWNVTDIKDGDKAATGAGLPVPTPLQDRLDKVENVALARGLAFKPISGGYKSTEVVIEAEAVLAPPLGVLFPWRLASGFAHGRRWSMLAFADTMQKQATQDPAVSNIKMENDISRVLYLGWAAATVIQGAVRMYDQRAGI
jgi:hypothetical protein